MPFVERGATGGRAGGFADGLAYDVITRLAKLRSLFVIARGTVLALHERSMSPQEAGRTLNVDYVVSGSLQRHAKRLIVTVELVEARTARIVWAEVFDRKLDEAFLVLDEIGDRIVASVASEIETVERNRAILKPPSSLDAWEAHHRGCGTCTGSTAPTTTAPGISSRWPCGSTRPSRAPSPACPSRTGRTPSRAGATASRRPSRPMRRPARASWSTIRTRPRTGPWAARCGCAASDDQSISELQRAVDLSPNFALAHYTLSFVQSQTGDPQAAIGSADHSRQLSPFDPMLFGMLATRAMALVRLGRFDEAAEWAVKAAARPNAHAHMQAVAAVCLALAGRVDEALTFTAQIHKALPGYRLDDFFSAFRFSPDAEALLRQAAARIGMA